MNEKVKNAIDFCEKEIRIFNKMPYSSYISMRISGYRICLQGLRAIKTEEDLESYIEHAENACEDAEKGASSSTYARTDSAYCVLEKLK